MLRYFTHRRNASRLALQTSLTEWLWAAKACADFKDGVRHRVA